MAPKHIYNCLGVVVFFSTAALLLHGRTTSPPTNFWSSSLQAPESWDGTDVTRTEAGRLALNLVFAVSTDDDRQGPRETGDNDHRGGKNEEKARRY